MPINLIHERLAISVSLFFFVMLVWVLWRYFRKETLRDSYRGASMISGFLVLVQDILGGYLWLNGFRPDASEMHILYGGLGVLGLPAVYSLTRGGKNRESMMVIGIGYLLLVILVLRAIATG